MAAGRTDRYDPDVADHQNLADPAYEPSDEELARLMRTSFAGLRRAREESLREMRERIVALQAVARARFEARGQAPRGR